MPTTVQRRRLSTGVAALLLVTLSLAGCSQADTGSYCDALTSARSQWKDAGATLRDPAAAARLVASVRQVEASAPPEVKADWTTLRTLFEKFTVARPDLTALTRQMPSFESAAKRVETHARARCGVDLAR